MSEKFRNKVVFGGEVLIDLTEDTVAPENVNKGIVFHAPSGETLEGTREDDPPQIKTAIPYTTQQEVTSDPGFNLAKVIIEPIQYEEVDNEFGGKTAKIGTLAPLP